MPDEERAAEAFGTLSDPTRIAILRAFAEAMDERELPSEPAMPVLSFSELHRRVDAGSTSRLSYHLEELDGTYLRHTDAGWKFTFAGGVVVRQFLSGAYVEDVELEPFEIEGSCPRCGAESLVTDVYDRVLLHRCEECGQEMGAMPVTPAQLRDRDDDALLESVKSRTASFLKQFREGVCATCGGVADVDVRDFEEEAPGELRFIATARCRSCWLSFNGPPSTWLASHPASVAFHWDHGVDATAMSLREMVENVATDDWSTDRVGPDEYEVTYRVDENALRLIVDDELEVARTERVRRSSTGRR